MINFIDRNKKVRKISDSTGVKYAGLWKIRHSGNDRIYEEQHADLICTLHADGAKTEVIDEIISFAKKYNIHRVILFGSRARGDFKRTSDIDIAVSGGDFDRFALDVDEETSTLLEFAIVDLDRDMQHALRESIQREGKILYEKE